MRGQVSCLRLSWCLCRCRAPSYLDPHRVSLLSHHAQNACRDLDHSVGRRPPDESHRLSDHWHFWRDSSLWWSRVQNFWSALHSAQCLGVPEDLGPDQRRATVGKILAPVPQVPKKKKKYRVWRKQKKNGFIFAWQR